VSRRRNANQMLCESVAFGWPFNDGRYVNRGLVGASVGRSRSSVRTGEPLLSAAQYGNSVNEHAQILNVLHEGRRKPGHAGAAPFRARSTPRRQLTWDRRQIQRGYETHADQVRPQPGCGDVSNGRPVAGKGSPASWVRPCLDWSCRRGVVAIRSGTASMQADNGQ
jgi:hypothetical protein